MAVPQKNNKVIDRQGTDHVESFRRSILDWYDSNRRAFPWRALPGQMSGPYHVWLSEVMLQQTTVQAVIPYFLKFIEKWPTVHDLAKAEQASVMQAWAGLGYYARVRNLHKCAKVVSQELKGIFPTDKSALMQLPGIGDYTSAAIVSIAFNEPATVMDANIERVIARVYAIHDPLPGSKSILKRYAAGLSEGRRDRPGDFAQGMMDLGASICTPVLPKCNICPINNLCKARIQSIAEKLPVKIKKTNKPQKYGYFYWVQREDGAVLFEQRPEKGMLGGMLGLPTSDWTLKKKGILHPGFVHNTQKTKAEVHHSFTHFDLHLRGFKAEASLQDDLRDNSWQWVPAKKLQKLGIPTLFKKAVKLIQE